MKNCCHFLNQFIFVLSFVNFSCVVFLFVCCVAILKWACFFLCIKAKVFT